jgi:hypothetical protein
MMGFTSFNPSCGLRLIGYALREVGNERDARRSLDRLVRVPEAPSAAAEVARPVQGDRAGGVVEAQANALSFADGHQPHAMPVILDQHHGSLRQLFRRLFQHVLEASDHEFSPRVAQPKQDHADTTCSTARRDDLAEIEIECQHDAPFPDCLAEDFAVRQFLQTFVAEMDCVMTG